MDEDKLFLWKYTPKFVIEKLRHSKEKKCTRIKTDTGVLFIYNARDETL